MLNVGCSVTRPQHGHSYSRSDSRRPMRSRRPATLRATRLSRVRTAHLAKLATRPDCHRPALAPDTRYPSLSTTLVHSAPPQPTPPDRLTCTQLVRLIGYGTRSAAPPATRTADVDCTCLPTPPPYRATVTVPQIAKRTPRARRARRRRRGAGAARAAAPRPVPPSVSAATVRTPPAILRR